MKVRFSVPGERSIDEVEAYVARDNPAAGTRLVKRIRDAVEKVTKHPRLGRVVPEFGVEHVRELIVDNYRVLYRIDPDAIVVLLVIEGHRLLPSDE